MGWALFYSSEFQPTRSLALILYGGITQSPPTRYHLLRVLLKVLLILSHGEVCISITLEDGIASLSHRNFSVVLSVAQRAILRVAQPSLHT